MTEPSHGNGDLRITLKDLYLAQQDFLKKQSEAERRLSETFADLKVTLVQIQSHIGAMDARNVAADQLHSEHAKRISDLEHVVDANGLRTIRVDRERAIYGIESRLDKIESGVVGAEAVKAYRDEASSSRNSARTMFWGMIVAIGTAIAAIVAVVVLVLQAHGKG